MKFHRTCTLYTELSIIWILKLTFQAFHFDTPTENLRKEMNNADTASDQIMLINPGRNQLQKEFNTAEWKEFIRTVLFWMITTVGRDQK